MKVHRLILIAALSTAAPAAEDFKKAPAVLDPAKAYLLVETVNEPPSRISPTISVARYDQEHQDIRGLGRAVASPVAAGEDVRFTTKPGRSLRPKGNGELHLIEVTPGTWTIEGIGGTAASLGSYWFEAPAGRITDLGIFTASYTDYAGKPVDPWGTSRIFKMALMGQLLKTPDLNRKLAIRPRGSGDSALPASFAGFASQPAVLTPGARFGNYLGGLVERIDRSAVAPDAPPPP